MLIQTIPTSSWSATSMASCSSLLKTVPPSPNALLLASSTAASASATR